MGNLGARLISDGLISDSQLRSAQIRQRETGSPLGLCLVDLGHVDEATLFALLAEEAGVAFVDDTKLAAVDAEVGARVPGDVASLYQAVPVEFEGPTLLVATADPTLVRHLSAIGDAAGCPIRPGVGTRTGVAETLLRLYGIADTTVPLNTGRAVPTLGGAAASSPSLSSLDTVRDSKEAVEQLLADALGDRSETAVDAPDHLKQVMAQAKQSDAYRSITEVESHPQRAVTPRVEAPTAVLENPLRAPISNSDLPVTEPIMDAIPREGLDLSSPVPPSQMAQREERTRTIDSRFRITEKLGRGGMAEVYKAEVLGAEGFHRTVVIKRILPNLMGDQKFVAMLIDEANIACQLNHPNIVQVYELGQADGRHFIVMEFVDGVSLQEIFERSAGLGPRVSPAIAAYIVEQLCEGLEYVHKKRDEHGQPLGIVHRDVNPANVLIDMDGHVKVIDFGIAKAKEKISTTQVGALKGKPGYFAPEQAQGEPLDSRADVFAAGIILYELLMHERLFRDGATAHELREVVEFDPKPRLRFKFKLPGVLRAACMWALFNDRDERCPSAGELAREMKEYLRKRRGDPRQELVHYIKTYLGPDAPDSPE